MKELTVFYSMKELNSFIENLKEGSFKELSLSPSSIDSNYVFFSFLEDKKRIFQILEIMKEVPMPYIGYQFMSQTIFTILCFVLKNEIKEVNIYGICNIKKIPGEMNIKEIAISNLKNDFEKKEPVFPLDLAFLSECLKSVDEVDFCDIKIDDFIKIYKRPKSTSFDWSLNKLMNHLNFKDIK